MSNLTLILAEWPTEANKRQKHMIESDKDNIYSRYLQTTHWLEQKSLALWTAGYKCQCCGSPYRLCVHHNTYENITCEAPNDLFVMCQDCHTDFHTKRLLFGRQLKDVDYEFLKQFVIKCEKELEKGDWYFKKSPKYILSPTPHVELAVYPAKVTTEVYDTVVEMFNCYDSSRRCEIWERGIELWIAVQVKKCSRKP